MATTPKRKPAAKSARPSAAAAKKSPPRRRPIDLDGERLTRRAVLDVALRDRKVRLDAGALRKVARCAGFLDSKLKSGEPIYGVTTGFGSNADRLLAAARMRPNPEAGDRDLVEELQRNLIVSHAVGVGPALPIAVVRAMLLIRVNTLLRGHSGVRTATVKLMVELLNRGITPVVPEKGSVGASGDLAPLAHLALPLLGEGEVDYQGHRVHAAQALAEEGLQPIRLSSKEGLALTNGTAQMLAMAVIALDQIGHLLKSADLNAALVVEAFCGRSAAFDERAHDLRPHPGQVTTAANLRALLAGSTLVDIAFHRVPRFAPWTPSAWGASEHFNRTFDIRWDYVLPGERHGTDAFYKSHLPFRGGKKMQPQDAYCLRCIPQVHGAVREAWAQACRVIDVELNAVTDNPLVFPRKPRNEEFDPLPEETVISAGNFHGMPLALVMSYVKASLPVLASIAERRINKLVDPATNDGLPPFLIGNEDGTDSGLMIVQYSAAALVNDLATRAHPACVYSVPTSANTEDHVSMGTNEIRQVLEMCEDVSRVLALELYTATQALEYRSQVLAAAHTVAAHMGTQTLRAKIRNISPVKPEETTTLAEEIKLLQEDLRKLGQVGPAPASARVLAAVRAAGVDFVQRDRLLKPDMDKCEALIASRALVTLVERELQIEIEI